MLIRPNRIMNERIRLMFQHPADCVDLRSTLSVDKAIDGKSERKLLSRICFASSGK